MPVCRFWAESSGKMNEQMGEQMREKRVKMSENWAVDKEAEAEAQKAGGAAAGGSIIERNGSL